MTRSAGLVVTACLLAAGCGRPAPVANSAAGVLSYRLGEQDGRLTLTVGQLTLVFEGVTPGAGVAGTTGSFPTSGVGGGSVDVGGVTIRHKLADGVCTVTVNDVATFQLTEGGTKLVLGGKTYNVNEAQTVIVTKDGPPR